MHAPSISPDDTQTARINPFSAITRKVSSLPPAPQEHFPIEVARLSNPERHTPVMKFSCACNFTMQIPLTRNISTHASILLFPPESPRRVYRSLYSKDTSCIHVRSIISPSPLRSNSSLLILFVSNTRSLVNKIDELSSTVPHYLADFIAIRETWLPENISCTCIDLPGFSVLRHDRSDGRRGGRFCVFVKDQFPLIHIKPRSSESL